MNSYDQQRDVETETESLKRYDNTATYYETRIESCEDAISHLENARISLQLADEEYLFLPRLQHDRLTNLGLEIGVEMLKLKVEKSNYEKELENINKGRDDL